MNNLEIKKMTIKEYCNIHNIQLDFFMNVNFNIYDFKKPVNFTDLMLLSSNKKVDLNSLSLYDKYINVIKESSEKMVAIKSEALASRKKIRYSSLGLLFKNNRTKLSILNNLDKNILDFESFLNNKEKVDEIYNLHYKKYESYYDQNIKYLDHNIKVGDDIFVLKASFLFHENIESDNKDNLFSVEKYTVSEIIGYNNFYVNLLGAFPSFDYVDNMLTIITTCSNNKIKTFNFMKTSDSNATLTQGVSNQKAFICKDELYQYIENLKVDIDISLKKLKKLIKLKYFAIIIIY